MMPFLKPTPSAGGADEDPRPALECLTGRPQLLAIARRNPQMALKLKLLLDLIEDGDWADADRLAEGLSFDLHQLKLESQIKTKSP